MTDYLENTSNSDPINRHKPLPPKALGYSKNHNGLRYRGQDGADITTKHDTSPCRREQERGYLQFSSLRLPQLAGVGDYLENTTERPTLSRYMGEGNSKSEGQNLNLDNLTVPLLPMCWEKGKG